MRDLSLKDRRRCQQAWYHDDWDAALAISDQRSRDLCLQALAVKYGNPDLARAIVNQQMREIALGRVASGTSDATVAREIVRNTAARDQALLTIAIQRRDRSLIAEIQDPFLRNHAEAVTDGPYPVATDRISA